MEHKNAFIISICAAIYGLLMLITTLVINNHCKKSSTDSNPSKFCNNISTNLKWLQDNMYLIIIFSCLFMFIGTAMALYLKFGKSFDKNTAIMITAIAAIASIIVGGIYRAATYVSPVTADSYSKQRLDAIDGLLTSYMGPSWRAIIATCIGFLLVIVGLLYLTTKNPLINSSISDTGMKRAEIIGGIALLIFTIFTGIFTYLAVKKEYKQNQQEQDSINNIGSPTINMQEVKSIFESLALLAACVIAMMIVFKMFKKHQKN